MEASAQGAFSLSGSLKGMPDSVKVVLVDVEDPNGGRTILAETMATGDTFQLSGDVSSPRMCNLAFQRFSPKRGEYATVFSTRFMADPASIILSAELPFDSLRKVRDIERHIRVSGSKANDEFAEYIAQVSPAELAAQEAAYRSASKYFETNDNKDTMAVYDKIKKQTAADLLKAQRDFIAAHPAYSISGMLMLDDINSHFSYTAAELDAIGASVKDMPDTARRATVEKALGFARGYLRESPYTDFAALDTLGTERKFSEFVGNGRYVMVDFWASWCGPCRAAIPHVRELYNKYGDNLQVIAVSLDSAEKPWRKAMNEEQMEWTQLWADKAHVSGISEPYQVHSIPYIMLLNPEGRIIYAGHDPDAVSLLLEKELH